MKVAVLIESPLQLLNANEYIKKHELEHMCDFYFLSSRDLSNLNQLYSTFSVLNLKGDIEEISVTNIHNSILTRIKYYFKINNAARRNRTLNYSLILVGNMRSIYQCILMNSFQSGKSIYLDDGNAAIYNQKMLLSKKLSSFAPFSKRILPLAVGLNANLKYDKGYLHIFSIYDNIIPKGHSYLKFEYCEYTYLNNEFGGKLLNKDLIYFIGTPFYWKKPIYNKFENYLDRVAKYYSNKSVKYFPHRYENNQQLNIIKSKGWEIINTGLPIELSLVSLKELPLEFGMFYSSACFSLYELIPNIKFRSFEIENTENLEEGEDIQNLYERYVENESFEVVNFNSSKLST
ncbi:hypothetical protein [Maribacter cobaltidurans]|uniref:Uncharacterized protein n=1 Tax=Maribacter cobaltidurans TaxID=1178778 RepID=A0A223V459_9FLAO|nr:hypothetical protein [Maribacter cobaltidurans]ASV30185.1 hypothetical protein CJ263_08100 [Maribacter cobaltidurans]GGD76469.1 hypothetical protein GCM10011412_12750 [Maribacter cobaltidurans]